MCQLIVRYTHRSNMKRGLEFPTANDGLTFTQMGRVSKILRTLEEEEEEEEGRAPQEHEQEQQQQEDTTASPKSSPD